MRSKLMLRRRRQLFILLGAVVVVALLPIVFRGGYEQTIMVTVGLYAIFGIGLQMTLGTAGILNMAHAAYIGLGAYSSGIVTVAGGSAWLGLLVGIVVSAVFALIVGLPILRLRSLYLAIATLCFALAITNIVGVWTDFTGGQNGLTRISPFEFFGFRFVALPAQVYLIGGVLLVFMLLRINLRYSVVGREFEAIKDSEVATAALGINHGLRKLQIFTIGSVTGAVGGSLYASYLSAITPELFGFGLLIQVFVIVAIGGMNSLWGAPIGALVVVLMNEFLLPRLAGGIAGPVESVIFGAILVVVMIFAPKGLVDEVAALIGRLWRRRRTAEDPVHAEPPVEQTAVAVEQETRA